MADDRTAIQAAFDRAGADQKFAMIPPGTWNVSGTVTLPDFPQANGLPYATINIPAGLAPGTTSASVAISFANPTNARISYTTKRYAVNFQQTDSEIL